MIGRRGGKRYEEEKSLSSKARAETFSGGNLTTSEVFGFFLLLENRFGCQDINHEVSYIEKKKGDYSMGLGK